MDTQISTSDWALKIECDGFSHEYDRSELDVSKVLSVDFKFSETKKILLTYRLDESEKYCKFIIPKCKDDIKRKESGDIRIFKFQWMPVNFAGIFEPVFEITTNENQIKKFSLRLDVLSKFDYEGSNNQNFIYMLNSLRMKHLEIFDFFNPSQIPKSAGNLVPPTRFEQFKVLEENMKQLENIVYQISLNPNKKLIKETQRDYFYALDMVDPNVIYDIATQRGGLIKAPNSSIAPELQGCLKGHLPNTIPVYRTVPTFNVFENQLLKRFLTLITMCSKTVERRFEENSIELEKNNNEKPEKSQLEKIDKYIMDCKEFHKKAQYMKRYSFLDDVSETDNIAYNTPVLQREVNYMRFYGIFKEFIKMPLFDFSEHLNLPILKLPLLYEYWVVIQIIDILRNIKGWKTNKKDKDITKKNEFGYLIKLSTGVPLIKLSNKDKRICLFYQKKYDTYAGCYLRPDITLEMHINEKLSRILVLDPKYRSSLGAKDSNDPESAINKMHAYKDAIRGKEGEDFSVKAAYAIFLGENYPENKQYNYKDIEIGGIRLFPEENDTTGIENLKDIIQKFINS